MVKKPPLNLPAILLIMGSLVLLMGAVIGKTETLLVGIGIMINAIGIKAVIDD